MNTCVVVVVVLCVDDATETASRRVVLKSSQAVYACQLWFANGQFNLKPRLYATGSQRVFKSILSNMFV